MNTEKTIQSTTETENVKPISTGKKIWNLIVRIFTILLVIVTVGMMLFTFVSTALFNKTDRSVFGFGFYVVMSDSMSLSEENKDLDVHFDAGDIIIIKKTDALTLQAGDVISFVSMNEESKGEVVTHMIREVTRDADGQLAFRTYGTNTNTDDQALVTSGYILGKYVGKLPNVGGFFMFMKTVPGYITCILIPFMLLILYQGVNCVQLFRRYKKEQMSELQAERAKIEEERAQSLEMLKELQALKEQLAQQQATNSQQSAPEVDQNEDKTE